MENNDNQLQDNILPQFEQFEPEDVGNPNNINDLEPEDDNVNQVPVCRFCQQPATRDNLFVIPCECTDPMRFCHRSCLDHWVIDNRSFACEQCQQEFRYNSNYKIQQPNFIDYCLQRKTAVAISILSILLLLCVAWPFLVFGCVYFKGMIKGGGDLEDIIAIGVVLFGYCFLVVAGSSMLGYSVFETVRSYKKWRMENTVIVIVAKMRLPGIMIEWVGQ